MFQAQLIRRSIIILIVFLLAACSSAPGITPPSSTPPPADSETSTPAPTATRLPPTFTPTPLIPTATETSQPEPTATPASGAAPGGASVGSFPDPQGYTWAPLVSGLQRPTDLVDIGGGRLLVLEQPGRVRVIADGLLLPDPFLDLTSRVGSSANEQGLLGIALHPDFAANGFFFLNYTNLQGDTVVSRFQASSDPEGRKLILALKRSFSPSTSRTPTTTAGHWPLGRTATSTSAWATAVRAATRRATGRT